MEDIDFFSGFCCWKFKQIAKKIVFGIKKNQLSHQCVFTLPNLDTFDFENVKK